MVTELGYVPNGKTSSDKFPFLVGAPYSMQLENGHQLNIYYDPISDWLTYSIYDEDLNILILRQVLRAYPINLSCDDSRVLYYVNGYIIDESVDDFEYASLSTTDDYDTWNAAITDMQKYVE